MKKLGTLVLFCVLCTATVLADSAGFSFDKKALVTGDWKWDGDSWELGNFPTASFDMFVSSATALNAQVEMSETFGQAWKYESNTKIIVDAPTEFINDLQAITVNDPATTPATGGYTHYSLYSVTQGQFTQSSLGMSGNGAVSFHQFSNIQSQAFQQQWVNIN
jgi:hypothetical protein